MHVRILKQNRRVQDVENIATHRFFPTLIAAGTDRFEVGNLIHSKIVQAAQSDMIDNQSDEASHKIIAIACRGGRVFQRPAVFLKSHSGFFATFLRHDTSKESEIPHVVFRDHYFAGEETFEHLLWWMHTRDIKAATTGDDNTENGDGKYWLHDWKALVDIWLLADYLIIPRLQNYITMVLIRKASTAKLPYELMNYIWAHQNSDISKLCRLFERLVNSKPCEVVEDNLLKLSPQALVNLTLSST
ncbi:hypothetical protein SCUP515_00664 [Seiridium cupressi]